MGKMPHKPWSKIWRRQFLVTQSDSSFFGFYYPRQSKASILSQHDAERLIHTFVSFRLDHCHTLLIKIPNRCQQKHQHVPYCAKESRRGATDMTTSHKFFQLFSSYPSIIEFINSATSIISVSMGTFWSSVENPSPHTAPQKVSFHCVNQPPKDQDQTYLFGLLLFLFINNPYFNMFWETTKHSCLLTSKKIKNKNLLFRCNLSGCVPNVPAL